MWQVKWSAACPAAAGFHTWSYDCSNNTESVFPWRRTTLGEDRTRTLWGIFRGWQERLQKHNTTPSQVAAFSSPGKLRASVTTEAFTALYFHFDTEYSFPLWTSERLSGPSGWCTGYANLLTAVVCPEPLLFHELLFVEWFRQNVGFSGVTQPCPA